MKRPVFFLVFLLLFACAPQRPELPVIPIPTDLEKMDRVVREQYLQRSEKLEALRLQDKASHTELAKAYGELAQWFHVYQQPDEARSAYEAARKLAPKALKWHYYHGRLELLHGNDDTARHALNAALQIQPGYVPAWVSLGKIAYRSQDLELAEEHFLAALEIYPECDQALNGLARVALERGDSARAVEFLEEALERQPEATVLHQSLGLAYRELGERELARFYLEKAQVDFDQKVSLTLPDPLMARFNQMRGDARFHTQRAKNAIRREQFDLAVEALQAALTAEPERVEIRINLGQALRKAGHLEESLSVLDMALRQHPRHAAVLFQRALTQEALGEADQALESYRKTLGADPARLDARLRRAQLLRAEARIEEALRSTEEILEEFPDQPQALLLYALCLLQEDSVKHDGKAREALEKLHKAHPEDLAPRRLLARLLATSSQAGPSEGRRAVELLRSEIRAGEPLPLHTAQLLAMAWAKAGEFSKAIIWQEAALQAIRAQSIEAPWIRRRLEKYRAGETIQQPWAEDERPLDLPIANPFSS